MACVDIDLVLTKSETVRLLKDAANDLHYEHKVPVKEILEELKLHFKRLGRLEK